MDWPVIGALTGVTVLAGVVGAESYLVLTSAPPPAKANVAAPILLVSRSPESLPGGRVSLATAPFLSRPAVPHLSFAPVTAPRDNPIGADDARPPHENVTSAVPPAAKHKKPSLDKQPSSAGHLPQSVDRRYANVLTHRKIDEFRRMLALLPEQRPLWPAVEAVLLEIGRTQLAQIERGESPQVDSSLMMRLYWAGQPLLGSLQQRQKERVRSLASSLGYSNLASKL